MRVLLVFLIALSLRAAAQSTCTDLERLASRASSGISCNRDSQCSQLQCDVTQTTIRTYIRRARLTLLPCNQPPAVRLVLYNPSNAVIVNRTFDSTTTLTLVDGVLSVTVTVQHPTSSSLRLGMSGRVTLFFFSRRVDILPNTDIALNTSACLSATTAPTVVTSAAATGSQATLAPSLAETCRALDTLRNNAQSLSCNRNDQCDIVYCTVTDSTVRGFVTAANLTLLPCNQPPAVRVTATNPSGGVVLDRVISRSETFSLPQGTTLRVTLNQLTNAIGFGATASATVFGLTSSTTLVPYTQIPIDTSGCSTPTSMASPTSPSSTSSSSSSSIPPSTTSSTPPSTPPSIPSSIPPSTPPSTSSSTSSSIPPSTPPSTSPSTSSSTPPSTTSSTPPPTSSSTSSSIPPSTSSSTFSSSPSTTPPSTPSPTSNPSSDTTTNTPTITPTVDIPQRNMCIVLQQIASRAIGSFECSTNQRCDGVDCTADLLNNGMPFQSRVVILVCQLPRPAVEIILLGSNGVAIVNETVDHSEVVSVQQFLQVNITLDQYQNAIGLQVEATLLNNPPAPVIEYTLIPTDTSNCQHPTLTPTSMTLPTSPSSTSSSTSFSSPSTTPPSTPSPTSNPSSDTTTNTPTITPTVDIPQRNMCIVLQQIASRAIGSFECSTNQRCDGVDCTADLLNNGMPFQSRAVILVCQLPRPAVEIILLGPNGVAIVNETVDHSKVVSVQQFLQVNITLDQYQNAIGLQVEATLPGRSPVPVIEYTLIPIDTSNCQRPTLRTGETDPTTTRETDPTTTDDNNGISEAASAGNPLVAGATVLFLSLLGSGLCTPY